MILHTQYQGIHDFASVEPDELHEAYFMEQCLPFSIGIEQNDWGFEVEAYDPNHSKILAKHNFNVEQLDCEEQQLHTIAQDLEYHQIELPF